MTAESILLKGIVKYVSSVDPDWIARGLNGCVTICYGLLGEEFLETRGSPLHQYA